MRRVDNLTTFMCRLSLKLGASTSWNALGLSRPVMGLRYFYRTCETDPSHMAEVWKRAYLVLPLARLIDTGVKSLVCIYSAQK